MLLYAKLQVSSVCRCYRSLSDEYRHTGLREVSVTELLQSQRRGVNSAAEEQRVKLRFTGASCQSEEPWSTVAMVTSRGGRRAPAGCRRWKSGWINRKTDVKVMNSSEHIYSCFGDKALPHLQLINDQLQSLPLSANRANQAETPRVKLTCSRQAKNSVATFFTVILGAVHF